jgi:uncharacterized sporulation protein YeaH/YhbH (DUF444 family)
VRYNRFARHDGLRRTPTWQGKTSTGAAHAYRRLQATHDDLRPTIEENAEQIKRLEIEQQVQLIRIAQIQQEIDDLKKNRP